MTNLLVLATKTDTASYNLYKEIVNLLEDNLPATKRYDNGNPAIIYENANMAYEKIRLVLLNESLLHCNPDDYADDNETICFLSKHAAKSNNNSITMHPIGNFGSADYGGMAGQVVVPDIMLMNSLYENAAKNNVETDMGRYEVSFEAVHHGPYSKHKCVFFELGSTSYNWNDIKAAKIMATIFYNSIKNKHNVKKAFFGIGSSHYCAGFYDLLNDYYYAGSCPDYALSNFNEDHINIISSYADIFVLHHNIKKTEKARIIGMLDRLDKKYLLLQ
ncbi:MAG: D-aminoacyl-tRNA deacylase [Candidatus Woesearchaeota archaeon]